jgi:hypothetical protein
MDLGKVIYYLDLWRDYMKSDNNKLGYKSKSTGFISGGISSFEDLEDDLDHSSAKTVDQAIDDLPAMQKTAIYIIYLGQKPTMNDTALEYYYDSAQMMLQRKLKEKNLY